MDRSGGAWAGRRAQAEETRDRRAGVRDALHRSSRRLDGLRPQLLCRGGGGRLGAQRRPQLPQGGDHSDRRRLASASAICRPRQVRPLLTSRFPPPPGPALCCWLLCEHCGMPVIRSSALQSFGEGGASTREFTIVSAGGAPPPSMCGIAEVGPYHMRESDGPACVAFPPRLGAAVVPYHVLRTTCFTIPFTTGTQTTDAVISNSAIPTLWMKLQLEDVLAEGLKYPPPALSPAPAPALRQDGPAAVHVDDRSCKPFSRVRLGETLRGQVGG